MASLADTLNELKKKVYDLERQQARGSETIVVVGTCVGTAIPDAGAKTNPCRPRTSATLHEVTIELDGLATSDVTWDILKSGVSVGTVTCPSAFDEGTATIDIGWTRGDQFQLQATTPGAGYTSCTGHLVWHTTRDWWHPPVLMFGAAAGNTFAVTLPCLADSPLTVTSSGGNSSSGVAWPATAVAVTHISVSGTIPTGGANELTVELVDGGGTIYSHAFLTPDEIDVDLAVTAGDFHLHVVAGDSDCTNVVVVLTCSCTGTESDFTVCWTPSGG